MPNQDTPPGADQDEIPDLDKINTPVKGRKFNLVTDGVRCGAKTKGGGTPCKKHPVNGTKRCKLHGGASPQAIAKAERDAYMAEVEKKVNRAVRDFDLSPVDDPLTQLQILAAEVLEWKNQLLEHVQHLTDLRYSTEFNEQIRGEVTLYERALDRAVNVLATIARLNIDERLAQVTESQAKQLEEALFAAFDAAGIPITDPDTREVVTVAFGRHLSVA